MLKLRGVGGPTPPFWNPALALKFERLIKEHCLNLGDGDIFA